MTIGSPVGANLGRFARGVTRGSSFRFLVVGAASVIVDAGLLYVLHDPLALRLELATALSFLAGFAVNFVLNRQWAFASTGRLRNQFVKYIALVAGSLALTIILVKALTALGMMYLTAKILTVSTNNYFISKKWIFN